MSASPTSLIRVVVVQCDNRVVARAALCHLLENQPDFIIAGEAGSHADALIIEKETRPDVIVLDTNTCGEKEVGLLTALCEEAAPDSKAVRVLVLTATRDDQAHHRAIAAGALGLVMQDQPADILFRAIKCLHAGEIWIERTMAAQVMRQAMHPRPVDPNDPQKRIALLTERETEVIVFICEGLKNQAIAERLFISEATVRHRLTSIFEKLKVADRLELVIFAYRYGLAELPT
jgi:DNA-binding NarL/FixJ family response regulator